MPGTNSSAALPLGHFALRSLIVLNWIGGVFLAGLLLLSSREPLMMAAFKLSPSIEATRLIWGMRAIVTLGLATIPLNYVLFTRLLAIVETVRSGDPFVAVNAARLHAIAWTLLSLQIISMIIAGIGRLITTPAHPVRLDAGFSVFGWLAVLLTFVLARVFAAGTTMREDLEGTV